jgi:NADPH-dependent 2,4-dienoyl-CoA reductase/sulfur reductase-like enzyme
VAHLIIEAGGKVAAIVDVSPFSEWAKLTPKMAARPDLLLRGIGWQIEVALKRIPVYRGYDVTGIEGQGNVQQVKLRRLSQSGDQDGPTISIEADALCIGHGLTPATEVYRLLGAEHDFVSVRGGWIPRLDSEQRTTIAHLYGAGDGCGLLGAAAAPLTGTMAAYTAAFDLGCLSEQAFISQSIQTRVDLGKASRFGEAMASIARPRPELLRGIDSETVVCRCEDLTAGDLKAEIDKGARTLNALKSATRCGMGPCGGRMCGESAATLLECSGVDRQTIGQFTARPPLRPISLGDITREFEYADIPLPEPAPA